MSDIGNSLREARIRKGLTIKDVEDGTKIRSKYLEALEQDDYEVLPGPVFVKAFLRTYASYLRLDADELIEEYRRIHEPHREEPAQIRTEAVRRTPSRTTTERKKRRARRNQRGYALVAALAVVAVVLLAWFGSSRGDDSAAPLDSASFAGSVTSTRANGSSTTTTEATAAAGSTTSSSVLVTSGENVELVVAVTEQSCWLVVREDNDQGAELYAGTLSAGGQKTFDSAKRYWMNIGVPEVLSLSINGNVHTLDAEAGTFIVTEAGIEPTQ